MRKIIVIQLLLLSFACSTLAQHTLIYTNSDILFEQGKELYSQRKYAASYRSFEKFLQTADNTQASQIQEAQFYMSADAFELRQDNASKQLQDYLLKHPYTPFSDRANSMLGILYYEVKDYKNALIHFNEVKDHRLGSRERVDFLFSKGFSCLQTGNNAQARDIFKQLKGMKTRYDLTATYYYAYAEYSLKNYDVALPEFLKIEENPAYKNIVPYYIVQIYYAQKQYDKLNSRAEQLLKNNPNNPNNAEIYRISGEIAYRKADYNLAISHLKNYEKMNPKVLRNDMYLLGLSYYQLKNYTEAIKYLSKVTNVNDEMSENAYLHLGNSYIKTKNIDNARLAYESAIRTKFNKNVREEAMFNYALTTYESNSGFGEAITAFEQLLSEYPNSKYRDKSYDYLSSVFLTTKNYKAAYQSILKMQNPTAKLLETKQYLLFQMGTEAFAMNNYDLAIESLTLSLESSTTGKYSAESYYWRAESYYRIRKTDLSIRDLKSFFANPNAKLSVNKANANYSLAYGYFSQKNYDEALNWFLRYLDNETNAGNPSYPDALNRAGDCYFYNRNFAKAETFYNKAAAISPNTGDYAMFQAAYVAGIQKNYSSKVLRLEKLLTTYPKSEYTDNALYEMGRAYLLMENNGKAISSYQRLLNKQPNSALARKAALEIGMIYFNENSYEQAIAAFKNVIFKYPGSEESYTALESLETVYVEINDVQSYLAYTKTLGRTIRTTTASREDSISYIASERLYISGKYAQAISGLRNYINKFCPGGRYCTTAQYYLADSYYKTGDKDNALIAYQSLLKIPGNQYSEEAIIRCAEMTFDKKDYSNALNYFKQLQSVAQTTENKNTGRLGVLRCSYFLNDHQTTINIVNEIMSDPASNDKLKSEARYNRAKAYLALNQANLAISDLKTISLDTRSASGAEAKFLLASIYFDQGKLAEAESEVMDFSKKNTPHQFWLAKSFVLLSDIYIQQGDDFQAKQYLLSLQKNYKTADEIQGLINSRLEAISVREQKKLVN